MDIKILSDLDKIESLPVPYCKIYNGRLFDDLNEDVKLCLINMPNNNGIYVHNSNNEIIYKRMLN